MSNFPRIWRIAWYVFWRMAIVGLIVTQLSGLLAKAVVDAVAPSTPDNPSTSLIILMNVTALIAYTAHFIALAYFLAKATEKERIGANRLLLLSADDKQPGKGE